MAREPRRSGRLLVRPGHPDDAEALAPNLHPDDLTEVLGLGSTPVRSLMWSFDNGFAARVFAMERDDGMILAMAAIIPQNRWVGVPWLLCRAEIAEDPGPAMRLVRREFGAERAPFALLHNICIDRPERLRLLERLGFDIGPAFVHLSGVRYRHFRWTRKRPRASATTG